MERKQSRLCIGIGRKRTTNMENKGDCRQQIPVFGIFHVGMEALIFYIFFICSLLVLPSNSRKIESVQLSLMLFSSNYPHFEEIFFSVGRLVDLNLHFRNMLSILCVC